MEYVIGLLVLLVGLLVSIALHEVGHMVPAKRFGVRVSRYMVGFGPTLWSRTRGETEYGLKAIPLGGYVRLIGMFPPADVVGARPRAGRVGELVAAAREQSAEEIRPGEDHRAFYRLSTPKKLVVMLGGPVMNLLIAAVLVAVVLMGVGIPGAASTTVGMTLDCILPADAERTCTSGDAPTPSSEAGLEVGDRIVSYDGRPVASWAEFTALVQSAAATTVPMVVERDGREVTLDVEPVTVDRPVWQEDGTPLLDASGEIVTEPSRYIGFSPTRLLERQPASAVPPVLWEGVTQTAAVVVALPVHLYDLVRSLVTGTERDSGGVLGLVGVGRAAGEIAASDPAVVTQAERVGRMLSLLASLNLALFAFNLLPLLPLDGGHVVAALWEGLKRQVARWRRQATPAPADVARMMPLAYGVFIVLALMSVVLVYADIVSPVSIT